MTNSQCKLKFEERVNNNIVFNDQEVGVSSFDTDTEEVFGFEEIVIKNIPTKATSWKDEITYKFGDIVSFNNEMYISRKDFNTNNTVFDSFYWLKKELKAANVGIGFNISKYIFVRNNTVVSSVGCTFTATGTVNYSNRIDFDVDASSPYFIPLIQPLYAKDIGKPANDLMEIGVYNYADFMGQVFLSSDTFDDTNMTIFSAIIEV